MNTISKLEKGIMNLKEVVDDISDDFGSTFSIVGDQALANVLSDSDLLIVEEVLTRHLGLVKISFERTYQMSKEPSEQDIWIIKIS